VVRDTLELTAKGRSPIVLTERREHLERLAERLAQNGRKLIALHGDMRPAEHRAAYERLTSSDGDGQRIVLATGRYIGEGFDDPCLDALLLAMPIAWKGTVVQYAGRLHSRSSRQARRAHLRLRRRRAARAAPHVRQAPASVPLARVRARRDRVTRRPGRSGLVAQHQMSHHTISPCSEQRRWTDIPASRCPPDGS
jgi:superfamily II DNA or RNA helicase